MTGFALILGKAFGEFTDISEDSFGFVVFWNLCDLIETDEAHFWSQAIFSGQFQSNDKSKQNGYLSNIPRVRDEIKPRNLLSDTKYRFSLAANQGTGPGHVIRAAANERALPRFTIDQNSYIF